MTPRFLTRPYSRAAADALVREGLDAVAARIYSARGIRTMSELDYALSGLAAPEQLLHAARAGQILADGIRDGKRLMIVADYDCDGATACALGMRALRAFGARVDYLVPNRFEYGYGLTPEIVRVAAKVGPDILITVDNGIASVEGVQAAKALGIETIVTDHHLPGAQLPQAACIVNPNQPGCDFPSKALAGVGVMFYVMLALRAELRARGAFGARAEPNLAALLDLVALGTVADVVKLDANNRILVDQGLRRIRQGRAQPGIRALFQLSGRDARRASTFDLGFMLGPRLNAAGRLTNMTLGIECLITDDPERAAGLAQELDRLNRARREIEAGMQDQALAAVVRIDAQDRYSLSLFDPAWHQGVVGILASRLKEKFHRPVIAFARGDAGELKGSGRSLHALHLRDALDLISKREPNLLLKFGGHAQAAGLSLREQDFPRFCDAFEAVAREWLSSADLEQVVETDGALANESISLDLARRLQDEVWGQGFPQPCFQDRFQVDSQRAVGEKHLKLKLRKQGKSFDAIWFSRQEPAPGEMEVCYRLQINSWNGSDSLQLVIEHGDTQ